ncbi:terminase small subunit [Anaerotignum sp.]|uniref:terminase small subunit n=1 Tax=Anaerotignum sp. TaxID=2039241 RepID=UPI00271521AB|nr:terminase small subunit [Anaerotignum sp.]
MVFTTEKQKKFANEYLIDLNATRAYKKAYPKIKNDDVAAQAGSRLLRNVKVSEYIEKRMKDRQKRTEITQDKVVAELAKIGFAKVTDFLSVYDGHVFIKSTDEIEEEKIGAIAGIKKGANGIEVKLNDKVKALELLGKHLGMFDKVEEYKDALEKLDLILEGIDNAAK